MLRSLKFIILFITFSTSANELTARIYNGDKAKPGQFPWHVHLKISGEGYYKYCGGSLISDRWVLSAAHCFNPMDKIGLHIQSVTATLGSTNILNPNNVVIKADYWIQHWKYVESSHANDIALVYLSQPAALDWYSFYTHPNISTISLPTSSVKPGTAVQISGYGYVGRNNGIDSRSDELLYINLTTVEKDVCLETFVDHPRTIICAEARPSESVCHGDSGSALVVNEGDKSVVVGVAHGVEHTSLLGCMVGYPQMFTDVALYLDWIKMKLGLQ